MRPIPPLLAAFAMAALAPAAWARLPPPDAAAQAKAAETKARTDWQAKVDAYQLCRAQDRIAARFRSRVTAPQIRTAPPAASASAAIAAVPPDSGRVAAPAGTPVSTAAPPPCVDPGAFSYAPPEQKPLESSGAHSPPATAASPPSVKPHSGEFPPKR